MSGSELVYHFPEFDDLPKISNAPQGCIWGFYDRNGKKDEVGSINLLTPSVVHAAATAEIKEGCHVQLDWPLHSLQYPGFDRKSFEQKVVDLSKVLGSCGFDDEIHINTQSGSQWDSLKHHAYQKGKVFYNGLTYEEALNSDTNGIHNWCERGGIVGRGVLVDMVRFYERRDGQSPHPWQRHEIPLADLQAALSAQNTNLQQADILLIRSGFVRHHNRASDLERRQGTAGKNTAAIGLRADEEMVRWLYARHLAAVAGDTVAFEAWPPTKGNEWVLHEWALVWWGMPIGELWDLERLAGMCAERGRWSFFLTSAPLHVRGGVGSPPGAIAIF